LIVPAELSRPAVERDDRTQIQVVAGPTFAAVLRHAVAGRVVHEPKIGIRRTDKPHRAAATLPGVVLRPALRARLAWRRHDEESPRLMPGLRVDRHHLPAESVVGAQTNGHEAVHV